MQKMSVGAAALPAQAASLPIDFSAPVRRILVAGPDSLEEFLFFLPMLKALREGFEGAHLCAVIGHEFAPLLANSALVDELFLSPENSLPAQATLIAKLHRYHFDMGLACSASPGSTLLVWSSGASLRIGFDGTTVSGLLTHRIAREEGEASTIETFLEFARVLGCVPRVFDYGGILQPSPESIDRACAILAENHITEPFLLVSLLKENHLKGSAFEQVFTAPELRWPLVFMGEKTDGILLKELTERRPEKKLCDLSRYSVNHELLAALCLQSRLFLGWAGARSHLAAAMGKSVVALCHDERKRAREEPRGVSYRLLKNDATSAEIIQAVQELIGL